MQCFRISLISLLLPFSAANAFDCGNIKLPSTAVICTDTDLMTIADQRQATYEKALRMASASQKKALIADQLGWIRTYSASCGVPLERPVPSPITPDMHLCFRSAGRSRIAYLDAYAFDLDVQRSAGQPASMPEDPATRMSEDLRPTAPAVRRPEPAPAPVPPGVLPPACCDVSSGSCYGSGPCSSSDPRSPACPCLRQLSRHGP